MVALTRINRKSLSSFPLLLMGVLVTASVIFAADPQPAADKPAARKAAELVKVPAPDAKQIDQWVRDLDSDDFVTREAATLKLSEAGATAAPAVEKAALSESFEQSSRAMRILKGWAAGEGKNVANKDAAKKTAIASLERLSTNTNKSVAKKATDALESLNTQTPKEDPNMRRLQLPGGGVIQIQIQNGGIIQGIGGIQGVKGVSISKTSVNGVESTDVTEASGRKIKIEKNKTIKVTVTEKVDGKDKSKTYEADDEESLKKKHPDAHKLFEKYGKNKGIPNFRALGIQRGNLFPAPANRAQALPNRKAMQKSVTEAQEKLEAVIKQLDASKKAGEKADMDSLRSQVEEAIADLKNAQGK